MYYILCENDDFKTTVGPLEMPINVTAFIEEKINEHNYSLDDFKVIRGIEVNLKIIKTPIKVLITN